MKRWLALLKDGGLVVPVINGQRKEPVPCRVTRTLVVIGKYAKAQRFSRKTECSLDESR